MRSIKAPQTIGDRIIAKASVKGKTDENAEQYYIDTECKIPAQHYVTDDGDIVLTAKVGGTTYVSVINNSALKDMSEVTISEGRVKTERSNTGERKQRVKKSEVLNADNVVICEISLGHYRNKVAKVEGISELLTGVRKYYDKTTGDELENDKGGNVKYRTAIICAKDNKEAAIAKMKELANELNITVDWEV